MMQVSGKPASTSTPPSSEISLPHRLGIFLVDFLLLSGVMAAVSGFASARTQWSVGTHVLFPLVLLPLVSFLFHKFLGTTPGLSAFGYEKRMPNGERAPRAYDWVFLLIPRRILPTPGLLRISALALSALIFFVGTSAYLWMRDPTLRPFDQITVPLHAPQNWVPLPFFYATGAFPMELKNPGTSSSEESAGKKEVSVEFALPYEKGPPNRFLGKITVYWRELDSRLILTGPQTLKKPGTQAELKRCVMHWLGCVSARRLIWKNAVLPSFEGRTIAVNQWFEVPNEFLTEDERAQGIYLRALPERGRVREAYFLVGPKMALQGFILDRPDRAEGELASQTLTEMMGSFRLSSDLQAPRAFLNPKLGALRITEKSSLTDLISAEAHLLAKVSIEPKQVESFYHLSGLAVTLYRVAKREGRIELAASSKTIVKNALLYARDVDASSKRIPDMEKFQAEVDAK